ncbi:efflux RND transporter permease subunit [Xylophilus sp. GOD-11R]|uniref:efflux RND transporter permease subunit n=1 Tax=Xylophilus sp. GOD-11R TaxID=3089814 RepID=UPI00298D34D6|nr:efflux RND transporter permease subunit [Xylophilus sp. GOD-11R]WPB57556.1 efflux RND transporter permease subunit [Xylophilus sp. GOD-11R]
MARFFIDRPIFAWVLAIVIMLAGAISIRTLPLEQYPNIAPPSISITANYTGASAKTVEDSVTQVIEQQLKGLDNLIYMGATSSSSGQSRTTLTFNAGTNPDVAQMQVQNKLQQAMPRLPTSVQSQGVTVTKAGNDFLMIVSLYSENPALTRTDIGDYINSNLVDPVSRLDGVAEVQVLGSGYAMRIWLDAAKLEKYGLIPSDVTAALNAQNAQVSAGQLGGLPALSQQQLSATVTARSKLQTPEQFENVLLRTATDGSLVLVKDVARVELGAESLTVQSRLNGRAAAGMGIVLANGANALKVSEAVVAKVKELEPFFPNQMKSLVGYDTTPFVQASIHEVVKALIEAMLLVVLIMYLFLQNFRATLIPTIAVPVVLLGTFGVLSALGYSINTLTMFGMVLAIGLLVDDAIVVVENVERVMSEEHLSPKEATRKSMDEITPALIGIALVLSAVFIPMAFFGGSTGIIYRQFSVTIVAAMALSVLVALTLTPALCATMLKHHEHDAEGHKKIRRGPLGWVDRFFAMFNRGFDKTAAVTEGGVRQVVRRGKRSMVVYLAIAGVMAFMFWRLPTSFLPVEDQGTLQADIRLPAGATDARTQQVMRQFEEIIRKQPEVVNINTSTGQNGDQASGRAFIKLKPWEERPGPEHSAAAIVKRANAELAKIRDARVLLLLPPAVRGLGASSGFNFFIQDTAALGHDALVKATDKFLEESRKDPELTGVRNNNLSDTAQFAIDIDDRRAGALGLATADINTTLSAALGGTYVNDFLDRGRVKRVYIQGDAPFRMLPDDVKKWTVRNATGQMVPFSSFSSQRWTFGSPQLQRFNGVPAYEILGSAIEGVSSGTAMQKVSDIMTKMPQGIGYALTGASFEERRSGAQAPLLYAVSILFVFLCLAALYESWSVPFSVILVVPLGIIGALAFTGLRGMSNDVYFQVGLLTTVGLSCKNAILIVEFAVQLQDQGRSLVDAIYEAVRLRLRPILMTSLAFGFGVLPLVIGTGAGAAGRQAIGTAVFGGMVSATVLGIFFVPVFFVLIRGLFKSGQGKKDEEGSRRDGHGDAPAPEVTA